MSTITAIAAPQYHVRPNPCTLRDYLDALVEAVPCGAVVYDASGHLVTMNEQANRLLCGASAGAIDADGRLQGGLSRLSGIYSGWQSSRMEASQEQVWTRTDAGQTTLIAVAFSDLPDGFSLGALRDVTREQVHAEQAEQARRSQALADLSAVLAQEMKGPLSTLQLFARTIAEATQNVPGVRQWCDHLQSGLRSLSVTVENVLQFYSQVDPVFAPVAVGDVLRDTLEFLRPLSRQRNLRVQFTDGSHGALIRGDVGSLQQLFINLAMNAFRVLPSAGRLDVALKSAGDLLTVELADNGPGMPPDTVQLIFTPGFTTHHGSAGLGLAVCKKIVEHHAGSMQVSSRAGMGTTFTVVLPLFSVTRTSPSF
jgi:signal transduction histidine kinase